MKTATSILLCIAILFFILSGAEAQIRCTNRRICRNVRQRYVAGSRCLYKYAYRCTRYRNTYRKVCARRARSCVAYRYKTYRTCASYATKCAKYSRYCAGYRTVCGKYQKLYKTYCAGYRTVCARYRTKNVRVCKRRARKRTGCARYRTISKRKCHQYGKRCVAYKNITSKYCKRKGKVCTKRKAVRYRKCILKGRRCTKYKTNRRKVCIRRKRICAKSGVKVYKKCIKKGRVCVKATTRKIKYCAKTGYKTVKGKKYCAKYKMKVIRKAKCLKYKRKRYCAIRRACVRTTRSSTGKVLRNQKINKCMKWKTGYVTRKGKRVCIRRRAALKKKVCAQYKHKVRRVKVCKKYAYRTKKICRKRAIKCLKTKTYRRKYCKKYGAKCIKHKTLVSRKCTKYGTYCRRYKTYHKSKCTKVEKRCTAHGIRVHRRCAREMRVCKKSKIHRSRVCVAYKYVTKCTHYRTYKRRICAARKRICARKARKYTGRRCVRKVRRCIRYGRRCVKNRRYCRRYRTIRKRSSCARYRTRCVAYRKIRSGRTCAARKRYRKCYRRIPNYRYRTVRRCSTRRICRRVARVFGDPHAVSDGRDVDEQFTGVFTYFKNKNIWVQLRFVKSHHGSIVDGAALLVKQNGKWSKRFRALVSGQTLNTEGKSEKVKGDYLVKTGHGRLLVFFDKHSASLSVELGLKKGQKNGKGLMVHPNQFKKYATKKSVLGTVAVRKLKVKLNKKFLEMAKKDCTGLSKKARKDCITDVLITGRKFGHAYRKFERHSNEINN